MDSSDINTGTSDINTGTSSPLPDEEYKTYEFYDPLEKFAKRSFGQIPFINNTLLITIEGLEKGKERVIEYELDMDDIIEATEIIELNKIFGDKNI